MAETLDKTCYETTVIFAKMQMESQKMQKGWSWGSRDIWRKQSMTLDLLRSDFMAS